MKIPKTVRNIGISVVVMMLIFLIAGVVYVFISGGKTPPAPAKATVKKTNGSDILRPVKPAANAPEGVAIETFTSPVKAGDNSSIGIRSLPASACTISVTYNGGLASHDSGLVPKTADIYGFANWAWTVEPSVPPGTYPVKVICTYNGKTGTATGNLEVTAG